MSPPLFICWVMNCHKDFCSVLVQRNEWCLGCNGKKKTTTLLNNKTVFPKMLSGIQDTDCCEQFLFGNIFWEGFSTLAISTEGKKWRKHISFTFTVLGCRNLPNLESKGTKTHWPLHWIWPTGKSFLSNFHKYHAGDVKSKREALKSQTGREPEWAAEWNFKCQIAVLYLPCFLLCLRQKY